MRTTTWSKPEGVDVSYEPVPISTVTEPQAISEDYNTDHYSQGPVVAPKPNLEERRRFATKEDELIHYKTEVEQRRAEARRAKVEREDAEMQMKRPLMNKHSQRLLERNAGAKKSLAERSQDHLAAKAKHREQLLAAKEKQEQELLLKPQINDRSKKMQRQIEDMEAWNHTKESRRDVMAQLKRLEESVECSFRPTLNKQTERIMKSKNKHSKDSAKPVGERLIEQAEANREKQEELRRRRDEEARQAAKPEVAPHSSNLPRSGDVADRLYNLAEQSRQKKRSMERRAKIEETYLDKETGRPLYQPQINKSSEAMVRRQRGTNMKVEDSLVKKGEVYQQRQQQRALREDATCREKQRATKINQRSEKLAVQLEQRTQTTATDRLAKPIGSVRKNTLETLPKYSFKPKLNRNTSEILEHQHGIPLPPRPRMDQEHLGDVTTLRPPSPLAATAKRATIAERSALWEKKRAAKEKAARSEQEAIAAKDCSFTPQVSTKASKVVTKGKTMIQRNEEWARRRAQKLEAERHVKELEEMAQCT